MTQPVCRPLMRAVEHSAAGEALDRLINIADRGDGGGARGTKGLISMADLCYLDAETREDILIILAYIAQNRITYAYEWGRREDMARLIEKWRG